MTPDELAALTAKVRADEAWRAAPCPNCGRTPYTREQHRFLTGNYACRNRALGPHRHWSRRCEGCDDLQWRPALDEGCSLVGIGEG